MIQHVSPLFHRSDSSCFMLIQPVSSLFHHSFITVSPVGTSLYDRHNARDVLGIQMQLWNLMLPPDRRQKDFDFIISGGAVSFRRRYREWWSCWGSGSKCQLRDCPDWDNPMERGPSLSTGGTVEERSSGYTPSTWRKASTTESSAPVRGSASLIAATTTFTGG